MKKIINKIINLYLKITQPEIRIWSHLFSLLGWSLLFTTIILFILSDLDFTTAISISVLISIYFNYLICSIPLIIIFLVENIIFCKFQTPWFFIFENPVYKILWGIGNITSTIYFIITIICLLNHKLNSIC